MTDDEIDEFLAGLMETLAAVEHERWAAWQGYMHRRGVSQSDGSLVLPAEDVVRWERQIGTAYGELTEAEKESDREQVRRYLPILATALKNRQPRER